MLLCSKSWPVQVGRYFMSPSAVSCFFILPHNPEELMESLCLFRQCQHSTRTLLLSLFLFLCLSLLLSHEVNIFCRKADGELVLTTSRSASQSLQSSRQPRCVSVAPVYVCVCACVTVQVCMCVLQQYGISMADLYLNVHLQ